MGSLSLTLSHPQIVWRLGEASWHTPGWAVVWQVHFDRFWDSVEVTTGGDLKKMPGTLRLRVGEMDHEPENEEDKKLMFFERGGPPIGTVTFIPAYEGSDDGVVKAQPDSYECTLFVSEAELDAMVSKVLAGQGPWHVDLKVPRFKYGSLPDGSHQKWDNTEQEWTKIDGATFVFGTVPREIEEAEEEPPSHRPPEVAPSAETQAITSLSRQMNQAAPWLFALLIAILLALIIRR